MRRCPPWSCPVSQYPTALLAMRCREAVLRCLPWRSRGSTNRPNRRLITTNWLVGPVALPANQTTWNPCYHILRYPNIVYHIWRYPNILYHIWRYPNIQYHNLPYLEISQYTLYPPYSHNVSLRRRCCRCSGGRGGRTCSCRGGCCSKLILTSKWTHTKSALNHQRTCWMPGRLHDIEGDVMLRRINKLSLLLPDCNICYVAVSWRGWWKMLTHTISGVTARIKYKRCDDSDEDGLITSIIVTI
jgi:hypothetical protein